MDDKRFKMISRSRSINFSRYLIELLFVCTIFITPGASFPTTTTGFFQTEEIIFVEETTTTIPVASVESEDETTSKASLLNDSIAVVTSHKAIESKEEATEIIGDKDFHSNEEDDTTALTTVNKDIVDEASGSPQYEEEHNVTQLTDYDAIIEPDPDKKEILGELEDIWYYTEKLGDDQSELKSSLSSLIHMTYARVYEESDDVLGRLKHLLKKLRAKLLDEKVDKIPVEKSHSASPVSASRKKRSNLPIFLDTFIEDPDENNLLPLEEGTNSSISSNENYHNFPKAFQSTLDDKMRNVMDENLVHVAVFQPINDSKPQFLPSKTYTKFESLPIANVTILKQENQKVPAQTLSGSTTTSTTPKYSTEAAVEDIIQSIINVLKMPIQKPVKHPVGSLFFGSDNIKNSTSIFYPTSIHGQLDSLPSYVQKIANELGLMEDRNETNANIKIVHADTAVSTPMSKNGPTTTAISVNSEFPTTTTPTPSRIINTTAEKVLSALDGLASLPNAARFVLLFSITISIIVIALGLYSLGPPIVLVGVLGIVLPVFLLLLFPNNEGKRKKAKFDVFSKVTFEEVADVLNLIVDAMSKYETF